MAESESESRAHADRENVAEALSRHGFDQAGIDAWFAVEAEIARRDRARQQPVEQAELDFGDWE